jgi:Domain of unknown function (DUF1992)
VSTPKSRYESIIDQQIRMAQERGDFDDLPGLGKPLPNLGRSNDELWWVKDYIRREGLSTDALLPTPLALRKEIERLPEMLRDLPSEQALREVVAELNGRIAAWLRAPSGPYIPIGKVDVESIVAQWRAARRLAPAPPVAPAGGPATTDEPSQRLPWWRRLGRRSRG